MRKTAVVLITALAFLACSDYDEQEFTVLLPSAGPDQLIITQRDGTTIQLDGSDSNEVNDLGFEFLWEITSSPGNATVIISDPGIAKPTLEVSPETSGRIELSLTISNGDQIARDVVNINVNPLPQLLFVNAIDGTQNASLQVPVLNISGEEVAPLSTDATYYDIDTNIAANSNGEVTLQVNYNGTTLNISQVLRPIISYTLYLVGTETNPELLLVEKTLNQNTLPETFVGLDAIILSPEVNDVQFFIDATSVALGILPVDTLFLGQGLPESFGTLSYPQNKEIVFPFQSILPLPIWATVNGQRISNDTLIGLPNGVEGNFGTFILVPDSSSEFGNTLTFINNSALLPQ